MKIAIYGICKNEAKFARRFAESIRNANQQPDGVFILDTGSTDGTQDILREYKFKVNEEIITPFSFDAARNIALSKIPDDIDVVVSVDLDDIMHPNWREVIEKHWKFGETTRMYYPYINDWVDDEIGKQTIPQITIWGFKVHDPKKYYWDFPIHEVIMLKENVKENAIRINEFINEHHPDVEKERVSRLKIFEDNLDKIKSSKRMLYNYGRELFYNKFYDKAILIFKEYLNSTKHYLIERDEVDGAMQIRSFVCRLMGEALFLSGEKDKNEILSWYLKSVSESPYQREPWLVLAFEWLKLGDGLSAYSAAKKGMMLTDKSVSLQIEDSCWDYRADELLKAAKDLMEEQAKEYINNIEGWMSPLELDALRNTAMKMNTIVEVGSWKGRSTHALLTGCKGGTVYSVDTFKGTKSDGDAHKEAFENSNKVFKQFKKNLKGFKNLKVLKMSSEEAAKKFKDKSIDMVFLDGDHTYEAVKKDIELWLPKTKNLICGHDYYVEENVFGVKKAVDEKFGKVKTIGSIWSFKV